MEHYEHDPIVESRFGESFPHTISGPHVILTAAGWRRWLSGHPWVFRDDLYSIEAASGDCAAVFDPRGREVGRAIISGKSKIALRAVTRHPGPWDDRAYFEEKLSRAIARRVRRAPDEAERVVCAEADELPGLIIDRYADVFCVQHAIPYWERRRQLIIDVLRARYSPRAIVARDDFSARGLEDLTRVSEFEYGETVSSVSIREGDVLFNVDPLHGQKTGFFLDQRDNRERIRNFARGRVLDVFCGDGSFGLHLAKAGAEKVIGIESSEAAIVRAKANAERNGVADRCEFGRGMAFDELRERARRAELYDLIILDPPAFAKNRQEVPSAFRGYAEINSRAMRIVAPGGYLATFSCSYHMTDELFMRMLYEASSDCHRRVELVERMRQSADHPILMTHPESSYLKGALLRIDS
ncbi:MAG: class I SAM-dependent rRNA methyltransferase [Planctomycetes bacterium]|nr:class I SAM-dependent rRNA methyltransferase [Planctomycetota bacterium]